MFLQEDFGWFWARFWVDFCSFCGTVFGVFWNDFALDFGWILGGFGG